MIPVEIESGVRVHLDGEISRTVDRQFDLPEIDKLAIGVWRIAYSSGQVPGSNSLVAEYLYREIIPDIWVVEKETTSKGAAAGAATAPGSVGFTQTDEDLVARARLQVAGNKASPGKRGLDGEVPAGEISALLTATRIFTLLFLLPFLGEQLIAATVGWPRLQARKNEQSARNSGHPEKFLN